MTQMSGRAEPTGTEGSGSEGGARLKRRAVLAATGVALCGVPWIVARSQTQPLRIGATFDNSGVEKGIGQSLNQGAMAYFNAVNKAGGIHGRQIEVVTADDQFNPEKARDNALKFASDASVLALVHPQGTRQTAEIMKAVKNLPIVGPNTGTTALHKSGANNVFWVRTNYDLEVERLVRLADSLGLKRFALAYPNDPFGQAVLTSFRASLASRGIEAVGVASTPNTASLEVEPAAKQLAGMQAQVLIMSLAGTMPALHKAYRTAGGSAICLGLSVGGSAANIAQVAKSADKPIFSVIVPSPSAQKFEVVRAYQRDMLASGFDGKSLVSMEGYVDARVLAEGLRRAGPKADRESLVAGLESMTDFDLGGMRMRYGTGNREGNTYTDIVSVDEEGRLKS